MKEFLYIGNKRYKVILAGKAYKINTANAPFTPFSVYDPSDLVCRDGTVISVDVYGGGDGAGGETLEFSFYCDECPVQLLLTAPAYDPITTTNSTDCTEMAVGNLSWYFHTNTQGWMPTATFEFFAIDPYEAQTVEELISLRDSSVYLGKFYFNKENSLQWTREG